MTLLLLLHVISCLSTADDSINHTRESHVDQTLVVSTVTELCRHVQMRMVTRQFIQMLQLYFCHDQRVINIAKVRTKPALMLY